jgi:drug/metabolite transporter (DMT)-like permease
VTKASCQGLALVAVLALVWGSNFLWIKVALDGLSPVQLTFARMAAGALVLALIVHIRGQHVPRDRQFIHHITVAALVGNAIPYLLFAIGEQTVDSSLAGVLNATTPLWTVLIAMAAGQERRPTRTHLIGLAIGFAGALILLQPWQTSGRSNIGGELACLAAAASYGISFVYIARYLTPRGLSPFVLAYGQTLAATALLLPALLVAGREPMDIDGSVVAATAMLGFVGTGLAYVLNYAIIARDGPTAASTVTYLLPVVAVALGAAVLDEPITGAVVVGTGVVLIGIALTRRNRFVTIDRRPDQATPTFDG